MHIHDRLMTILPLVVMNIMLWVGFYLNLAAEYYKDIKRQLKSWYRSYLKFSQSALTKYTETTEYLNKVKRQTSQSWLS